ncbi:MAG: hypothetical protein JO263_01650, partial [Candidatus Eremiobacteraeota bacterium]|nr:hypothetical protein [Candidatus Eremiobacteraeota bacterium]
YQLLPLIAGVVVAQRLPGAARKLARPLGYITFAAFLILLAVLFPAILRGVATVFGTFGLFAMFATAGLSLVAGWIFGGSKREYRRTLAIGTTLRNPGVAMMIATTQFPESGVAGAVAAYFLVQVVVASVAGAYFKRTA